MSEFHDLLERQKSNLVRDNLAMLALLVSITAAVLAVTLHIPTVPQAPESEPQAVVERMSPAELTAHQLGESYDQPFSNRANPYRAR